MAPQDGVGGWAPRPMNESAASAMIAPPMPSVAATITGAITLGSTWRAMMRTSDAPSARAAWTYSRPRVSNTWPRTMRAMPAQPTMPMTTNTTGSDGFIAAAMAIKSSSDGNASVTSATRMMMPSTQRPQNPATSPSERRGEIAAKRITGSEPWRKDSEQDQGGDDAEADTGPAIAQQASSPQEWRRHGGLNYVTRDSTPRASG